MADISVSGRMLVKSLKDQFKKEFDLSLRIYKGNNFADESVNLASIRKEGGTAKADMKINGRMLVGNFEKQFLETYGIKVKVASKDDSKLIDGKLSLSAASKG